MKRLAPLFLAAWVFAASPAWAYQVIQQVELKTAAGEWISVAKPDKIVEDAEPAASFFNQGKIPPGDYVNVRMTLADYGYAGAANVQKVFATNDFPDPVTIKKGSFVKVAYLTDFFQLVVDEDRRLIDMKDVTIEKEKP